MGSNADTCMTLWTNTHMIFSGLVFNSASNLLDNMWCSGIDSLVYMLVHINPVLIEFPLFGIGHSILGSASLLRKVVWMLERSLALHLYQGHLTHIPLAALYLCSVLCVTALHGATNTATARPWCLSWLHGRDPNPDWYDWLQQTQFLAWFTSECGMVYIM